MLSKSLSGVLRFEKYQMPLTGTVELRLGLHTLAEIRGMKKIELRTDQNKWIFHICPKNDVVPASTSRG